MTLYKLPFAFFPVRNIYARSREDIVRWLDIYERKPFEVLTSSGKAKRIGAVDDIIEVEKGELVFDFEGAIAGNQYASIDFLPDFAAQVRLESLPHFQSYLARVKERREGDLYIVESHHGGIISGNYVPLDVFRAFKSCDVSSYEERARQYIESLNKAFAGLDRGPMMADRRELS